MSVDVGTGVCVSVAVGCGLGVLEGVGSDVEVLVAVSVGSSVDVSVGAGLGVAVSVGSGVAVLPGVRVGGRVSVDSGVSVAVDVRVDVPEAVRDGRMVDVLDGVSVGTDVRVAVPLGRSDGVDVVVEVWDGVRVGSGVCVFVVVAVAVLVGEGTGVAARRFSANCVAVWSISATTRPGLEAGSASGVPRADAVPEGGDSTDGLPNATEVVPVARVASLVGEPLGDATGLETDGEVAGSLVAGDVSGGAVPTCGVPALDGRSVAIGLAVSSVDAAGVVTAGDAGGSGLDCSDASRSAASCVKTGGATVTTSSRGWDEERVNRSARKRLATKAPAAMMAFVRFKRDLMRRASPAIPAGVSGVAAGADRGQSLACKGPFYAQK